MQWTGERMIPGASPPGVEERHRVRYQFVIDQEVEAALGFGGLNILDAPCGEGYGSAMLKACGFVIGLDIDPESIDHARTTYRRKGGPFFYTTDIAAFDNPGWVRFDAVVCFEGIEHVEAEAGRTWLAAFARWTDPDARLYLSSPNPQTSRSNDTYHKHEYRPGELQDLVEEGGWWKVWGVYGQYRDSEPRVMEWRTHDRVPDWAILKAVRTEVRV